MKREEKTELGKELDKDFIIKQTWAKPILKTLSLNATLAGESATSNDAMSRSGS